VTEIDLSLLINYLEDEVLTRLVTECAMLGLAEEQVEEQWKQSISFFQKNSLQRRDLQIRQALNQAEQRGDENEVLRLNRELFQLNQERQNYDEAQNS
jgi:hypothetical protein